MSDKCEWYWRQYDDDEYYYTECENMWTDLFDIPDICPFCGKEVSK